MKNRNYLFLMDLKYVKSKDRYVKSQKKMPSVKKMYEVKKKKSVLMLAYFLTFAVVHNPVCKVR